MDDGKSIRYKDLYALFEQILEKTMRLEQRDWSESPVKVWVNTFKVFLDEYMIEYKPLDYTAVKVVGAFLQPLGDLGTVFLWGRSPCRHVGTSVIFSSALSLGDMIHRWCFTGLSKAQFISGLSWALTNANM